MTAVRHPPGRAGRLWLRRRLATAERGSDQLGRKLRVLLSAREGVRRHLADADRTWVVTVDDARTWQLRAGVLGGQQAYARHPNVAPVAVGMSWTSVVGVTIPCDPMVEEASGRTASPAAVAGNAAVAAAADAFDKALQAAADVAVAQEADRRLEAEIGLTRQRVRALERRWLPALRSALAQVEQALEFDEQEEAGRLRLALSERTRRAEAPPSG